MQNDKLEKDLEEIDQKICELIKKRIDTANEIELSKNSNDENVSKADKENMMLKRTKALLADLYNLSGVIFSDITNYEKIINSKSEPLSEKENKGGRFVYVSFRTKGRLDELYSILTDMKLLNFELSKLKSKESLIERLKGDKGQYIVDMEFIGLNITNDNMEKLSHIKEKVTLFKTASI
ncbi:MAG: chorismate mutase [Clostridia bacterium]|nr:chorismate mutase [Clostridia bacterium]